MGLSGEDKTELKQMQEYSTKLDKALGADLLSEKTILKQIYNRLIDIENYYE